MRLMRVGEVESKGSTSYTPPTFGKEYDSEEDPISGHKKKSVLAKVKEKARKWRSTLSKKKRGDDNNPTPSWGVSLDDYEDEDPENLGAPIYESEMAPQESKEAAAKKLPGSNPEISEKHVLPSSVSHVAEHESPDDKQPVAETTAVAQKKAVASRTVTPTVTENLAPGQTTIPDGTHSTDSKVQNLTVSAGEALAPAAARPSPKQTDPTGLTQEASGSDDQGKPASVSSAAPTNEYPSTTKQLVEGGVSVKEYIRSKLEPGEDERALSQVISQAIKPNKSSGDKGMVDKLKEAANSLLNKEESSESVYHSARNSCSDIPISPYAHEVIKEEKSMEEHFKSIESGIQS